MSLYECVFYLHDVFLMRNLFAYSDYYPSPPERHRPVGTPCGLFQTRDGWVVFTVLNHQMRALH